MSDSIPKMMRIALVGAACFALVAVGFAAIIFVLKPGSATPLPLVEVASTSNSTARSGALPPASQADASDTEAAAKIEILNNLNSNQ